MTLRLLCAAAALALFSQASASNAETIDAASFGPVRVVAPTGAPLSFVALFSDETGGPPTMIGVLAEIARGGALAVGVDTKNYLANLRAGRNAVRKAGLRRFLSGRRGLEPTGSSHSSLAVLQSADRRRNGRRRRARLRRAGPGAGRPLYPAAVALDPAARLPTDPALAVPPRRLRARRARRRARSPPGRAAPWRPDARRSMTLRRPPSVRLSRRWRPRGAHRRDRRNDGNGFARAVFVDARRA